MRSAPRHAIAAVLLCSMAAAFAAGSRASALPDGFRDSLVAGSLGQPVALAEVPDPSSDTTRRVLFVEQRSARVGLVVGGSVFTVGTVPGVASVDNERGLLGVAVDPDWPARPYLYVHCTDGRSGHTIALSRFTLTGDLAYSGDGHLAFDAATRYDLRSDLPDNAPNHNGGTLRFGKDRFLYASLGDDATGCPAQDPAQLVGKILRLDVSRLPAGAGGPAPYALLTPPGNPFGAGSDSSARLVWTFGLRNPFRFQMDPQTGQLVIGDVGEDTWEELDIAAVGGQDMGWPVREGPAAYTPCSPAPTTPFTDPIAWYDHGTGVVIIAGPLYRRTASGTGRFPSSYDGDIFYLDYYTGLVWRITNPGGTWGPAPSAPGQPTPDNWATGLATTSDMIELTDGTLWYCEQFAPGSGVGEIHRIAYASPVVIPVEPPPAFSLEPARPNPMHESTTISWVQQAPAEFQVTIHDIHGRLVRQLAPPDFTRDLTHELVWDGRDDAGRQLRPGLYIARVRVGGSERRTRIALVR